MNNMNLNVKKCNYILFNIRPSVNQNLVPIVFNNEIINQIDNYTYLGLSINSKLDWSSHVGKIQLKIAPFVGVFRRIGRYLTDSTASQLYFSYIHSHLSYMSCIWGAAPKSRLKSLQTLQNKSLKAINNVPLTTPSINLYSNNILPLLKLIEYEYSLTIYKISNKMMKSSLLFITQNTISNRTTRNCNNYRVPNFKNEFTKRSLFYEGIKCYNSIPDVFKSDAISRFKIFIKDELISKYEMEYYLTHNKQ